MENDVNDMIDDNYDDYDDMEETPITPRNVCLLMKYACESGYTVHFEGLNPPASKEFIQNMEKIIIADKDIRCLICEDYFEENSTQTKLLCEHTYHSDCIVPWLEFTNTCPLCKFQTSSDDECFAAYKEKKRSEAEFVRIHKAMRKRLYNPPLNT